MSCHLSLPPSVCGNRSCQSLEQHTCLWKFVLINMANKYDGIRCTSLSESCLPLAPSDMISSMALQTELLNSLGVPLMLGGFSVASSLLTTILVLFLLKTDCHFFILSLVVSNLFLSSLSISSTKRRNKIS